MIKTLEVREGKRVRAGEVLATLDPTFAAADVSALELQLASLNAQIARAESELAQKGFDPSPNADPAVARYNELQKAYYLQRHAQFDAQMHSYDEQMAQTKATIAKLQNDQSRYGDRAKLAKEVEDMRATLAAAQVGDMLLTAVMALRGNASKRALLAVWMSAPTTLALSTRSNDSPQGTRRRISTRASAPAPATPYPLHPALRCRRRGTSRRGRRTRRWRRAGSNTPELPQDHASRSRRPRRREPHGPLHRRSSPAWPGRARRPSRWRSGSPPGCAARA